jgi:hypothetical protein
MIKANGFFKKAKCGEKSMKNLESWLGPIINIEVYLISNNKD